VVKLVHVTSVSLAQKKFVAENYTFVYDIMCGGSGKWKMCRWALTLLGLYLKRRVI
jgi:hypothetical protein